MPTGFTWIAKPRRFGLACIRISPICSTGWMLRFKRSACSIITTKSRTRRKGRSAAFSARAIRIPIPFDARHFSVALLHTSFLPVIPFALSLSKGVCRKCSSVLRQAQGERNDRAKTTDARGLILLHCAHVARFPQLFPHCKMSENKKNSSPAFSA